MTAGCRETKQGRTEVVKHSREVNKRLRQQRERLQYSGSILKTTFTVYIYTNVLKAVETQTIKDVV